MNRVEWKSLLRHGNEMRYFLDDFDVVYGKVTSLEVWDFPSGMNNIYAS